MNKIYNAVNPIKKGLGAFFVTRKAKISFLILVWSIVAIQIYVNYQEHEKNATQAVTAFSVVDDDVTEQWIKGYGNFGSMEISSETRREMLENLALKLGITDGYTFATGSGDGYEKMVLTKKGKYADTTLQIISMLKEEEEPEQYIVMEIQTSEAVEDGFSLYERVKRIYEEIGVKAQVSLELEMEKEGNYTENEKNFFVEEIFDLAKAKGVDSINENGIHTVYGYTRLEDSFLTLNEKKVNIQVVMTYAEQENKTYVKIGIPIVNSSY